MLWSEPIPLFPNEGTGFFLPGHQGPCSSLQPVCQSPQFPLRLDYVIMSYHMWLLRHNFNYPNSEHTTDSELTEQKPIRRWSPVVTLQLLSRAMTAMELSLQYLTNLLCWSHVNDDLCHNLISFNGVTAKIKGGGGCLALARNSIQKATADVQTQHIQPLLLIASIFAPSKLGAGNWGALALSEFASEAPSNSRRALWMQINRNHSAKWSNVSFSKDFHISIKSHFLQW